MAYIFCSFIQNELRGNFLMRFLIIQLRDRPKDNWYHPFENTDIKTSFYYTYNQQCLQKIKVDLGVK